MVKTFKNINTLSYNLLASAAMNRCASLIRGNLTWARYDLHLITSKTFNNFSTVILVKSSLSNLTNSASESWFYQTCHSSLSDDNSSISLFYGWGKNVTWTTVKNQINNHHSNQSQYSLQWKKLLNSLFLQIWAVWKELQSNRLHCISVERCWPKSNAGRHELCILPRESFLASPSSSFHKRSLLPFFFLVQMKTSQSWSPVVMFIIRLRDQLVRERAREGRWTLSEGMSTRWESARWQSNVYKEINSHHWHV